MYGSAREELVAEAIAGRRDEVFLVSKVLPQNASRSGTIAACERSLTRLKTDRLDCYLLHWRGSAPAGGDVRGLRAASGRREDPLLGREQFRRARPRRGPRDRRRGPLACNQVLYHLRGARHRARRAPLVRRARRRRGRLQPVRSRADFPGPHTAGGRVLEEIADRHHATPRQVALRFLVRRPSLFAIPKASNPEHAEENAGAGTLNLSDAELARIDAAFPLDPRPRSLPML